MAELILNQAAVNIPSGYILYNTNGFPAFKLNAAKKVEYIISEAEFNGLNQSGATTESIDEMLIFTNDGFAYAKKTCGSKLYGRYYAEFYDIEDSRDNLVWLFETIGQGVPESVIDVGIRIVMAYCNMYKCFPESEYLQELLRAVYDDFSNLENNLENSEKTNLRILAKACLMVIDKVMPLLYANEGKEWTYQDYQVKKAEEAEAKRKQQQSMAWHSQGLCQYCGGQLNFFKKCKLCGRE